MLTPLLETLTNHKSKGVCIVEMATEPIEDYESHYWIFSNETLPDNPTKKIEIKRKATKFVILKNMLYWCSLVGILL